MHSKVQLHVGYGEDDREKRCKADRQRLAETRDDRHPWWSDDVDETIG